MITNKLTANHKLEPSVVRRASRLAAAQPGLSSNRGSAMFKTIAAGALVVFFAASARAEDGVSFDVTLTRGGQVVAHPRMIGYFGTPMTVEVSNVYRFEAFARGPDARGVSSTTARISLFDAASPPVVHEFSILANARDAATVEYAVPGTDTRLKVVQSPVALANR